MKYKTKHFEAVYFDYWEEIGIPQEMRNDILKNEEYIVFEKDLDDKQNKAIEILIEEAEKEKEDGI